MCGVRIYNNLVLLLKLTMMWSQNCNNQVQSHLNIILLTSSQFSKCMYPKMFCHHNFTRISCFPHICHMHCPLQSSRLQYSHKKTLCACSTPSRRVLTKCLLGSFLCGNFNPDTWNTQLSRSMKYISFSCRINIIYLQEKMSQNWEELTLTFQSI